MLGFWGVKQVSTLLGIAQQINLSVNNEFKISHPVLGFFAF